MGRQSVGLDRQPRSGSFVLRDQDQSHTDSAAGHSSSPSQLVQATYMQRYRRESTTASKLPSHHRKVRALAVKPLPSSAAWMKQSVTYQIRQARLFPFLELKVFLSICKANNKLAGRSAEPLGFIRHNLVDDMCMPSFPACPFSTIRQALAFRCSRFQTSMLR